ncbi:hypothetical protein HZU77_016410 [Neisseriaceae bacterium TC5R-5]|nr:hypothetical protein [Neisseriaceae bacterium TC5R-5]
MPFTEYRFDPTMIKSLVAERAAALRANRGLSDLLSFGLSVVAERLQKDPRRYRDYGPYWPALKKVMNEAGYTLGEQSDPLIAQAYRGESAVETLIMADEFRTQYLAQTIVYTNQFMLDGESGEVWTLYDEEMELKHKNS